MSSQSLGVEQQALVDALNAEYAAVFGYGVVAAFSNPARAAEVSADAGTALAKASSTEFGKLSTRLGLRNRSASRYKRATRSLSKRPAKTTRAAIPR